MLLWTNAGYECQIERPVEMKQVSLVTWIQLEWDVFAAIMIFLWVKGIFLTRSYKK